MFRPKLFASQSAPPVTRHIPHKFLSANATGLIAKKLVLCRGHLAAVQNWEEQAKSSHFQAKALASGCRVSLRHLERRFKSALGMSPQEWLNRLRMRRATVLLNNGQSVKFAALELGFKQASHFSQMFKRFYGLAPDHFKQACRLQKVAEAYEMSPRHIRQA
jgi:transcriptional regulator GlxA family with amidase domain